MDGAVVKSISMRGSTWDMVEAYAGTIEVRANRSAVIEMFVREGLARRKADRAKKLEIDDDTGTEGILTLPLAAPGPNRR